MSNQDDVDTVRSRTDILQVVAPYVALKRSGRIWKGLCPFHNEKTPSFQVNPDLGRWHCFGQCSEGGDVFKFIQKVDNLSFPEALERLALKAGVTLTRSQSRSRDTVPVGEKDRLYAALNAAVGYYRSSLAENDQARSYLFGRGIQSETIEAFEIGYAGGDWDTLPRHLDRVGIARDDAVRAGILAVSERGGHYDKLRGRIVFPIVDVQGRTIAFGGRLMQPVAERPKYLNSAETPLFSKSKTLYGLSRARKAIADAGEAIVVEGYLDVITCHQGGFHNVVATLGTSLTEEHALIIGRLARRVLLAFDSDAAGIKAAQRANSIFEAQGLEVRMLVLPKGEDPDSIINAGRSEEFKQAISGALMVSEYRLKQVLTTILPTTSEIERTNIFQREILPILRATKSVTERENYIRLCARAHPLYASGAAMAEEQIRQDVDGRPAWTPSSRQLFGGRSKSYNKDSTSGPYSREYKRPIGPRQSAIKVANGLEKAEETIVQALLDPKLEHFRLLSEQLNLETFVRPVFARLVRHLIDSPGPTGVQIALEDPDLSADPAVARILLDPPDKLPELPEKAIVECMQMLTRHKEEETLVKLRELSRSGNLQANELYTKIMRERKGAGSIQKLNAQ